MPTIIVSGASGVVGRHSLEAALGHYRIFALARRSQSQAGIEPHTNLIWIQVDIGNWPAVIVLVHRAVGPAGWSIVDRARIAAGFSSFSEVQPDNAHRFITALETGLRPLIPEDSVRLLVSAIGELDT